MRLPLKSVRSRPVELLEGRRLLATSVLTYHNDNLSSGLNATETLITPGNLSVSSFGKRFATAVDGQIYSQPLYVPNLNITTGSSPGIHNTVFVATQHDSLYAIDSDSGAILYQKSFIGVSNGLPSATSVTPMPAADTNSADISPEVGITATPVIDPSTNSLYLTAKTKEIVSNSTTTPHYVYRLYKLNIQSGSYTSTIIGDTIRNTSTGVYTNNTSIYSVGTGDGTVNVGGQNRVYFNAMRQMNRPGLVLQNGEVYVAFASHGDTGPYHGWLVGFNAGTLAVTRALNTTPNGGLGGIWQGGGITAIDPQGYFYFETGNGSFNTAASNFDAQGFPRDGNYGDCFIKVGIDATSTIASQNINGFGLKVVDYFSPFNNAALNSVDRDLGSGGPIILPDSAGSAAHPHLIVGAGKESKVYLIDRDNMGKFDPATDHVVQSQGNAIGSSGSFGSPAFFNGHLYYAGVIDRVRAFTVSNASFVQTSQSTDSIGSLDGTISISANGTNNGLVWLIDRGSSTLKAYDANNLANQVWTSANAANGRDSLGSAVKFSVPTIADGHVFCGTAATLVSYGPPVPPSAPPADPTLLAAAPASGIQIGLTWQDNASNEDGYEVYQSPDNATFTKVATLGVNAQGYLVNGLQSGTPYWFKVRAFNSFNGTSFSGYSSTATATTQSQLPSLNFSAGFAGSTTALNYVGSARIVNGFAELTDGNTGEAGAVWSKTVQDIRRFNVNFTFQLSNASADGFTFTLQRASATAIGGSGGALGYQGIGTSVALKFDLYPTVSETGLYQNGAAPETVGALNMLPNIDTHSGHIISCSLQYNGTTLTQTLTDTVTNGVYSHVYTVNIPAVIGGNSAWVGFTGATGGETAIQDIRTWTFTTVPSSPPAAPTGLTGTPASGTQINLAWIDNSNTEDGFKILRKVGAAGTYSPLTSVGANVTAYMDTALNPDVDYYYQVVATNGAGDSGAAGPVLVHTPVPPITPTNGHYTAITPTSISMAWQDNADNESGFKILRKTGEGQFGEIANLPANSTTYTDNGPGGAGLLPGTEYDYHIQEYNIAGYSDFTGFTIETPTLAPDSLSASILNGQINLTWNVPANNLDPGRLTYNVYRGTTPGGEGATPIATALVSPAFIDSNVQSSVVYYYKVTALDTGGESATSNEASVQAPDTAPPVVQFGSFAYQSSPIQIAFRFNEDVSGSLSLADVSVVNLTTSAIVNPITFSYEALTNTATFNFASGPLIDGNYRATLNASGITDSAGNALDGDANGSAGGNYNLDFYFLNGDANRDRVVNFDDLLIIAQNYDQGGKTFSQGNVDYSVDGLVNFDDLLVLAQHYGTSVLTSAVTSVPSARVSRSRFADVLQ